jgi:hypothetical protein
MSKKKETPEEILPKKKSNRREKKKRDTPKEVEPQRTKAGKKAKRHGNQRRKRSKSREFKIPVVNK